MIDLCAYLHSKQGVDLLIEDMHRHKISKRAVSIYSNELINDIVFEYEDKLLACALVNPKEEGAVQNLMDIADKIKMIELNSYLHAYYPDALTGVVDILNIAKEQNLPIKIYSGQGNFAMPQQYLAHIKNFPSVKFIFLHMGLFDYGYGCVELAREFANVYLETSNQFEMQILRKALSLDLKEKLLFGSSYPNCFTKCSIEIFDMFKLDTDYKEHIFYKNANILLGL